MVPWTGAVRRVLALVGVAAVLFTPSTAHPGPRIDQPGDTTVFADTLSPGLHAGVVKRTRLADAAVAWAHPGPLGTAILCVVALLVAFLLRRRHPARPPASPGPILLRAPTRSPPAPATTG
jgi:hypothetical protein